MYYISRMMGYGIVMVTNGRVVSLLKNIQSLITFLEKKYVQHNRRNPPGIGSGCDRKL